MSEEKTLAWVAELQGGDARAKYGEKLLQGVSERLTQHYGEGFSVTNLRYMRQFYQVYSDRSPQIHHPPGDELPMPSLPGAKHHPAGDVLDDGSNSWTLALEQADRSRGFSPRLSWSHYRILSKVKHRAERLFYEIEAAKEGWSKDHLERQIHTGLCILSESVLDSSVRDGTSSIAADRSAPGANVSSCLAGPVPALVTRPIGVQSFLTARWLM